MGKIIRLTKVLVDVLKPVKNVREKNNENEKYNLFINDTLMDVKIRKIKTFAQKYKTLLFKSSAPYTQGFCFIGTKGFNSFGFYKQVDVVICDVKKRVVALYPNFEPNKATGYHREAYSIFVFFPGAINFFKIEENDIFRMKQNVI